MLHLAIIGSGPAGYYTAEAALKRWGEEVHVDIFDLQPVPFGLIRSGVAPDHQSIKGVAKRYDAVAQAPNVRFIGKVAVGRDVSIAELQELYDAVVLATGAPSDRALGIPGDDLGNVFGSAAFVGWYNGHPHFADLAPDFAGAHAVVIGNGNVALDIARILAKVPQEFEGADIVAHALDALKGSGIASVTILGRRGPHQIAMTPKELGELGNLERARPRVDPADLPPEAEDAALDPGMRKSVQHLRAFAADGGADKPFTIDFDFFAAPRALIGDGSVRAVEVERTALVDGRAVGTSETYQVPADLVIAAIGYRTNPIEGVPYDTAAGRFANEEGRILPGLYCVGWARRGPSGTIGTNRPDGFAIVDRIAEDFPTPGDKQGRAGFEALAAARGVDFVTFRDWRKIDEAEVARARDGAPREKFVAFDQMLAAAGKH
ncbi:FAD-dependent oxidoreductase [Novosphingobium sp. SG707]|uniref:FAD-dependent oxidoreductase n=1 Tax=Novosphingobium sp. SG707 TaxID=2586996 RepID=UPI0014459472|nr:FAD-dependent oxidoreductase [Novosphingobium sp. SG707]NKI99150.1 ferredoxin--NADP+ reductase [Novosphingobium sp. SG707]